MVRVVGNLAEQARFLRAGDEHIALRMIGEHR
jgi:hypothetical protein